MDSKTKKLKTIPVQNNKNNNNNKKPIYAGKKKGKWIVCRKNQVIKKQIVSI